MDQYKGSSVASNNDLSRLAEALVYLVGRTLRNSAYVPFSISDYVERVFALAYHSDDTPCLSDKGRKKLVTEAVLKHTGMEADHDRSWFGYAPNTGPSHSPCLTVVGTTHAKALKSKFLGKTSVFKEPNMTSKYLADNWKEIYPAILSVLRRDFGQSTAWGKSEDHAMVWVEKAIYRDALRSRLISGCKIRPYTVACWAVNSARTDISRERSDPVCRAIYKRESIKEYQESAPPQGYCHGETSRRHSETLPLDFSNQGGKMWGNFTQVDYPDRSNLEDNYADSHDFPKFLDKLTSILHSHESCQDHPELYSRVLVEKFVNGSTSRDLVKQLRPSIKVSASKIDTVTFKVRKVIAQARRQGVFDEHLPV